MGRDELGDTYSNSNWIGGRGHGELLCDPRCESPPQLMELELQAWPFLRFFAVAFGVSHSSPMAARSSGSCGVT